MNNLDHLLDNKSINKSNSLQEMEDWEAIRNFTPTKKVELSEIDNKLKEIRSDLNKISKTNYENSKKTIVDKIYQLFVEEHEEVVDENIYSENQKKIGEMIFDIVSTNNFLSDIYADLYVELVGKSEYFGNVLDNFIDNYKLSLNNIQYIDPDEDYMGFCNYNQKNEQRKSNSLFLINVMKQNMISKLSVLDLIINLQEISFKYIDQENKIHEVEEITENLFILINQGKNDLIAYSSTLNEDIWKNNIKTNIETFSKLKAKEHVSLSSRCVFKYMDM